MSRDREGKPNDPKATPRGRKAYAKPAIVLEESIEVMAALCDPNSGGKDTSVCAAASS